MAPTFFYTEFFEALDNKPDFKASFLKLQEVIAWIYGRKYLKPEKKVLELV